jgi:hypothetical protein
LTGVQADGGESCVFGEFHRGSGVYDSLL